jgi:hypothetical protein
MKWFLCRLAALVEVMHSPGSAFSRGLGGSSWLVPFFLFGILFTFLSVIQAPMQFGWAESRMTAAGAPPERAAETVERMREANAAGFAVVPVLLLVRWAAVAMMIWMAAQLWFGKMTGGEAMGVVAFSYTPVLLRDAAACMVLFLRGAEGRSGPGGLEVAFGLNLIFPDAAMPWRAALGNINLFEAWQLIMLAAGVAAVTNRRMKAGWCVVLPVWGFVSALQLGFLSLALPFIK